MNIKFVFIITLITVGLFPNATACIHLYKVDFDESMKNKIFLGSEETRKKLYQKQGKIRKGRKHYIYDLCKKLYEKNNLTKREPLEKPLIPKIVHIIWVGPHNPPQVLEECLNSVKKHLPGWEYKVWKDKDVKQLELENQEYYDEETNYGAKSDILRYELLYKFGGVYLDVDMIILQPLELLNHTYEFYAGIHPLSQPDVLNIGIIASTKEHKILRHCIDSIPKRRLESKITHRTGPFLFEESFYQCTKDLSNDRVIAFPRSFFYPLSYWEAYYNVPVKDVISPESFAIHLWAGTWKGQPDGTF